MARPSEEVRDAHSMLDRYGVPRRLERVGPDLTAAARIFYALESDDEEGMGTEGEGLALGPCLVFMAALIAVILVLGLVGV